MSEPLFELRGVRKAYRQAGSDSESAVTIFDGLDLDISQGEFLALMGPSGSGKSTLLNLLGGIDRADAGSLRFRGQALESFTEAHLCDWRARHAAFIFQSFNLLPMLSVARNVELPLMLMPLSGGERRRRVAAALELVGLPAQGERLPSQLSGGQQQRVAIARALVADTELILCDEPTGNLDNSSSEQVLETLVLLQRELGKTVVMVTHDPRAAAVSTRQLTLEKGHFRPREALAAA